MAHQVIKQPNGKYCLYSNTVDTIIATNLTKEDIINIWVEDTKQQVTKLVNKIINELENNGRPYHMFTKTFDEAMELIEILHGKEEMYKILKDIKA